ncbi:hypothetical protein EBZ38_07445 [bacterium]|nr:hypothetical protein [bacterium]
MKYTKEQEELLIAEYEKDPTKETVERLAEELNVSPRSIVGKLSRLNVYKKTAYLPKYGAKPVSKEELVKNIADALGLESDRLTGLEKAQKPALLTLEAAISKSFM